MADKTTSERILECIANNDIEGLKEIKGQIGRDKWLKAWRDNGSKMEDWLEPNPFIKFE